MLDLNTLYRYYACLLVEWADHVNKDPDGKVDVHGITAKDIDGNGTDLRTILFDFEDFILNEDFEGEGGAGNVVERYMSKMKMFDEIKATRHTSRREFLARIERAANRVCGSIVELQGDKVWGEGEPRLPSKSKQFGRIARRLRDLMIDGERIKGIDRILNALPEIVEDTGEHEGGSMRDRQDSRTLKMNVENKTHSTPKIPTAKHWYEITLRFVSDETVEISNRTEKKKLTCSELGLAKENDKRPSKRWTILLLFAERDGELLKGNLPSSGMEAFKRQRQQLATDLKALFGIEKDPFEHLDNFQGWKTRFHTERVRADSSTSM